MEKTIDEAIKKLAEMITVSVKAPDAIHYTQAALNLAHTKQVLKQVKDQ